MSRGQKQFLYGILYLSLFTLIGWGVFRVAFTAEPSCTDKKQNQEEEGVDCGGQCVSCAVQSVAPLTTVGEVRVFGTRGGGAALLGRVENPNTTVGASRFSYRFTIYDSVGKVKEEITGKDSIFEAEDRYLYETNITTPFEEIGYALLALEDVTWEEGRNALKPRLVLEDIATVNDPRGIRVSGVLKNETLGSIREVKVIALIFDAFGGERFAAQTLVSNIAASEARAFVISFPSEEAIGASIALERSRVIVQVP